MDGENHGKWKTLLFNGWFGGIIIFGKRPYNLSKSWEHIPSKSSWEDEGTLESVTFWEVHPQPHHFGVPTKTCPWALDAASGGMWRLFLNV